VSTCKLLINNELRIDTVEIRVRSPTGLPRFLGQLITRNRADILPFETPAIVHALPGKAASQTSTRSVQLERSERDFGAFWSPTVPQNQRVTLVQPVSQTGRRRFDPCLLLRFFSNCGEPTLLPLRRSAAERFHQPRRALLHANRRTPRRLSTKPICSTSPQLPQYFHLECLDDLACLRKELGRVPLDQIRPSLFCPA